MRKLSEIGKSLTKRRNESVDFQSPTDGERMSQSSCSDEHKSRDSIDIIRPPPPPPTPQTPERKVKVEKGLFRPSSISTASEIPSGRLSFSSEAPGSPAGRLSTRLSLSNLNEFPSPTHDAEDSEGKGKFRSSLRKMSLKSLGRSKSDHKGDKRVMNWVLSCSQFAAFAPKFAFTTWDQLLTYTMEDLIKLGLPPHACLPMSKIIAVLAEESLMEKAEQATTMPYALLQVPESRPRSFSYNNRAIATSEHVKTLEELFFELDTERKGFINESELSVALHRYGVVEQEGAKAWFADIDNNQRGVIDQQQFVDFMTYVYPLIFQTPSPLWSPRGGGQQHVEPPTIFLGGSCNPTSWRRDIVIPLLQKASISFFNPQVEEWHEGLIAIEARAKASATLLFFVIDSLTLSLATMIECTELITSGRPLVLVINDLPIEAKLANGDPMPKQVMRDANRARAYMADVAVRHRIQPYSSISRAACELIQFLHGGWTGGNYETRPRATLARKSEESWTALKQKVQAALMKMNTTRRGSRGGSLSNPPLPEPTILSLPPPRTPERASSNPLEKRSTTSPYVPVDPPPSPAGASSSLPELPFFSGTFTPPIAIPTSPTPAYSSSFGGGGSATSATHGFLGNSPPLSPSKMVPVNLLGNFPHLADRSPPFRSSTLNQRSSNMAPPLPPAAMCSPARMGVSSMERGLLFETFGGGGTSRGGHARAQTNSISSLADIAEGGKLEEYNGQEDKGIVVKKCSISSMPGSSTEPVKRAGSLPLIPSGKSSPRSSTESHPDNLIESPVTTPSGSTPSSFLSLSPTNSPTIINRSSFN